MFTDHHILEVTLGKPLYGLHARPKASHGFVVGRTIEQGPGKDHVLHMGVVVGPMVVPPVNKVDLVFVHAQKVPDPGDHIKGRLGFVMNDQPFLCRFAVDGAGDAIDQVLSLLSEGRLPTTGVPHMDLQVVVPLVSLSEALKVTPAMFPMPVCRSDPT